jgi:hypothetical protein
VAGDASRWATRGKIRKGKTGPVLGESQVSTHRQTEYRKSFLIFKSFQKPNCFEFEQVLNFERLLPRKIKLKALINIKRKLCGDMIATSKFYKPKFI